MKLSRLCAASCLGMALSAWAQTNVTITKPPGGTGAAIPMFTGTSGSTGNTSIQNSGVNSDNVSGLIVPGNIAACSLNGVVNGSSTCYTSAAAAVAAACSSSNPAVHFPSGIYALNATTGGLAVCNGLRIQCDSKSINGAGGVNFQAASGAAIWLLSNPNADITTGGDVNGVADLHVDGCTFDISQDSAALGAFRIKGIGSFQFIGTDIRSSNNPNPTITMDGAGYAYNNGDYNGEFYSLQLQDVSGSSGAIGVYITDGEATPTGSCSNDDKFIGGASYGYKYPFKIDCGNNNTIAWMNLENWASGGIAVWFTTQSVGGGSGSGNHLVSDRMEASSSFTGNGIQLDSGTFDNSIEEPYFSGPVGLTPIVSASGAQNSCRGSGCWTSTSGYASWFQSDSARGSESFGVGKIPVPNRGVGIFDMNGDVQFSGYQYSLNPNAIYYQYSSTSSSNFPWFRYLSGGGSGGSTTDALKIGNPYDLIFDNGGGTEYFGYIGSFFGLRVDGYVLPKASCGSACSLGNSSYSWNSLFLSPLTSDATATAGNIAFRSDLKQLSLFDGSTWQRLAALGLANTWMQSQTFSQATTFNSHLLCAVGSGCILRLYDNNADDNQLNVTVQSGTASGGVSGALLNGAYFSGGSADVSLANAGTVALWTHNGAAYTPNGITVGGGTNVVYRCTTAGTLPIGALTTVSADCGASVATSLTVN